jgi:prevent-host-death family protein
MGRRERTVGVRELKAQASRILRRIRDTREEVAVTHHGKVVAHIVSAEGYHELKAGRPDFWDALRSFRERVRLSSLGLGDELVGVRDRSKGRSFRW